MKTILRLQLGSFLLLAMVLAHEALADGCSSGKCPFTSVAPSVPLAPAITASASRGFTAIGGSRVADVNLSPEGRDRLAAGDKEEPLPKGFSTAADRAKLAARQLPPNEWSPNEIPPGSWRAQSHSSIATLKPREAKPFTRRSVAGSVKPMVAVKAKSSRGQFLGLASRQ